MPNKRKIKKYIKDLTDVLIEDAFIESINGDEKEGKKMDELIDSVIDDRLELLNRVSKYPNNGNRAEIKNHFSSIKEDLETKVNGYTQKVGRVV